MGRIAAIVVVGLENLDALTLSSKMWTCKHRSKIAIQKRVIRQTDKLPIILNLNYLHQHVRSGKGTQWTKRTKKTYRQLHVLSLHSFRVEASSKHWMAQASMVETLSKKSRFPFWEALVLRS